MKETLFSNEGTISRNVPYRVVIPDEIEGNMELKFSFSPKDISKPWTYTHFVVIDQSHGNVQIVNYDFESVTQPKESIPVGTYQKKYKLYVSYVVSPTEQDDIFKIKVLLEKEVLS